MKKIPAFWSFAVVLLVAGLSLFASDADLRVVLEDPAGDVEQRGDGGPGKDIVRLTLESDEETFYVTIELAEDVAHYLDGHEAGDVVEMHIDTDDDPGTGGIAFWGSEAGFEYAVTIRACAEFEGGSACNGALGGLPKKGYFTSFKFERHEEGKKQASPAHDDSSWESPREPAHGRLLMVAIPYSELGVESGSTLRVLVRESDGHYSRSYFPIARVALR